MRYTIILILCFSFFQKSFSQENKLSVIEEGGFNSVVLVDGQGKKEIVLQFAFKIKLLDTKILSSDKVCFIYESELYTGYEKFVKNDKGKWERSNTAGFWGGSSMYISPAIPKQGLKDYQRTYKIIDEDIVEISDASNTYNKDCREFIIEREKWIEDCRKSKKH